MTLAQWESIRQACCLWRISLGNKQRCRTSCGFIWDKFGNATHSGDPLDNLVSEFLSATTRLLLVSVAHLVPSMEDKSRNANDPPQVVDNLTMVGGTGCWCQSEQSECEIDYLENECKTDLP